MGHAGTGHYSGADEVYAALLAGLAASACFAADWPEFPRPSCGSRRSPGSCAALKAAGIDAVAFIAEDRDRPAEGLAQRIAPLKDCGVSWYVENIATDFLLGLPPLLP